MLHKYFHKRYNTSVLHEKDCQTDSNFTLLNKADTEMPSNETIRSLSSKLEERRSKSLNVRYVHDLAHNNVNKIALNVWLRQG